MTPELRIYLVLERSVNDLELRGQQNPAVLSSLRGAMHGLRQRMDAEELARLDEPNRPIGSVRE